jgi:2-polyprenyl-3-methyl-5-hydroxy-6-metoxy-1,4-benzoquinol methylase
MLISPEYAGLNRQLHDSRRDYGAIGHKWIGKAAEICRRYGYKTVLDYGCGKGTLKARSPEWMAVFEYDPAIEGKETPHPADLVVCTDVLEHVEPDCLDAVLSHIRECGKRYLLVVNTTPSNKRLSDGRNAHLIVEDHDWWRHKLGAYFDFRELESKPADLAVEAW